MSVRSDWATCEGDAGAFSRRAVLLRGALTLSSILGAQSALSQITVSRVPENENVLVLVFLRGGIDGLNAIVPIGDSDYYHLRPSLSIPEKATLKLDDHFGLHPALSSLKPSYDEGVFAAVHAVGSMDSTRSHFEAMSAMERGLPSANGSESTGWIARYLMAVQRETASPLRAVSIGPILPDSLRGGLDAIALERVDSYRLRESTAFKSALMSRYSKGKDEISRAGIETINVLDSLGKVDLRSLHSKNGTSYSADALSTGFAQVSALIRAKVGMEIACLDFGGWDTHVLQGGVEGSMATRMRTLAVALSTFLADVSEFKDRVSIVVMSEFGRRAFENDGFGTDHGRGTIMLALGAGVRGGKVFADWPGLGKENLEGPGDLRVTTDYRNVLFDMLMARKKLYDPSPIFPGLNWKSTQVWSS